MLPIRLEAVLAAALLLAALTSVVSTRDRATGILAVAVTIAAAGLVLWQSLLGGWTSRWGDISHMATALAVGVLGLVVGIRLRAAVRSTVLVSTGLILALLTVRIVV